MTAGALVVAAVGLRGIGRGRFGALDVTSRTSVMRFKATKQSIPEIGRTLGVDAFVQSSVQRAGNRVLVTCEDSPL